MKTMIKLLGTAALAFGFSMAQAAQVDCPASIADNVSGATDCEYSDTVDQDNTKPPLVVNTEKFFDFTDWTFLKKIEGENSGGEGLAGTYDFGATYSTMMLIFKDGANTFLVGYIVSTSSGTWESPFENPPFEVKETKENSHVSYYYRGGSVPEPATLMLLGLGLAGLAVVRRRRAK